jgi:amino acid permease
VNLLNVRIYGEVEFWLTAIKILTIVVIILVGFVIVAGGAPQPLLGLNAQYRVVPCSANDPKVAECVPPPGFSRTLLQVNMY